ncbi:hypothetical protein GXW71_05735 [Roseomonas hellenica]|uniref:Uncharacterized protein n=1 Tax=Plastoroseomonas hellenica TaxID=2687306 RepID=A0ABS5EU73_9PROT|nr:hypothetical protein [Plastoroseomonas hellenica]MBR0663856.1 hypothetical protein [Plastoroseomonas hellenica]
MRRITIPTATAALALLIGASAAHAGSGLRPAAPAGQALTVQYQVVPGADDMTEWERRRQWREMRQARDQARIEEAARREAQRIEEERQERRARWRARREAEAQYGYAPGSSYTPNDGSGYAPGYGAAPNNGYAPGFSGK